jgi:Tfp pilus assembly protein PilF
VFSRKMSAMIGQRIAELRRALAESPTAEAHLRLGTMLLKCNAVREAERELRAAVALDPKCAAAWTYLEELGSAHSSCTTSPSGGERQASAAPGPGGSTGSRP